MAYPFRIRRYELRRGLAAAEPIAAATGWCGVEFLMAADVTVIAEAPARTWGLAGGSDGLAGRTTYQPAGSEPVGLPSKVHLRVGSGDILTLESPGGGGWGVGGTT
jgi:N-methylhydantoinase B/oxoprolinase/acetone carboxylase alpha subunit